MKNVLAAAVVAVLAASSAAQEPASTSSFDKMVHNFQLPKELPPCSLEGTLSRIATETNVPVGLERVPECEQRISSGFARGVTSRSLRLAESASADIFDGIPVKELLGRLAARVPDYEWAIMDGVAVFRPRSAWADTMNPLAAHVPAIRLSETPVPRVVATILNVPMYRDIPNYPITIDFPGGTVIDALNMIVRTQSFAWFAGSNGQNLSVGLMMRRQVSDFGIVVPIATVFARR